MHLIRSCGRRPERNLVVDTTSVLLVSRFFVCNGSASEQHLDGAKFCGVGSVLYCPRGNKSFFSGRNSHLRANFPHFNRRVRPPRSAFACEMRNKRRQDKL